MCHATAEARRGLLSTLCRPQRYSAARPRTYTRCARKASCPTVATCTTRSGSTARRLDAFCAPRSRSKRSSRGSARLQRFGITLAASRLLDGALWTGRGSGIARLRPRNNSNLRMAECLKAARCAACARPWRADTLRKHPDGAGRRCASLAGLLPRNREGSARGASLAAPGLAAQTSDLKSGMERACLGRKPSSAHALCRAEHGSTNALSR